MEDKRRTEQIELTIRDGFLNRPCPEVDDLARIGALQGALRRLRGEVQRLAETRAKNPKKISTS